MCMQHTVILSSLCKWKHQKWLLLLLNGMQYATKEWRYAVHKAKVERYKGGGGVTLITHRDLYIYINSYHYALSHIMTQVA